jgi:chemotaxis receptor (MCP) glutamine deamidase CheD
MNRLSTLGLVVFTCICVSLPCYAHEKISGLTHFMIPDNAKEAVASLERFNTPSLVEKSTWPRLNWIRMY